MRVMSEDWTWAQWALGAAGAVVLPLIMRRIFFHKRARIASSAGSGSLEEYMTNHGMSELDAKFQVAVDFIATKGNKLTNEQRLTLYAFYKQAHFGKCSIDKPSAADFIGSAKWESWSALGEMDPEIAKTQYIDWVQDLFEDFDVHGPKPKRSSSQSNLVAAASREELSLNGSSISTASVQSMPSVDMTTEDWKVTADPFHFASTGDVAKVKTAIEGGFDIDAQDDEGRTMLHWAVDREQKEIVEILMKFKAKPDVQDSDGMTPLHYAASCEHEGMATVLVAHGARTDIEDSDGETPLSCAASDAITAILTQTTVA